MENNLNQIREQIGMIYGPVLSVLSESIRGFFISDEGFDFICADYAAIEARVLAWLSGEDSALKIFAGNGDIYQHAASSIYRVPLSQITKDQRFVGKVAVLALGYGGGKNAFQKMARAYKVGVSDQLAEEIKLAWRSANSKIVEFWKLLEDAAIWTVKNSGKTAHIQTKYCSLFFKTAGSFLWLKLPSQRALCYPYPKLEEVETPWGEMRLALTYMGEDTLSRKWERQKTYGGKLSENITQAVARDLLAEAMLRLEENKYPIVLHCHDEIVCQVPALYGSVEEMVSVMTTLPKWAKGLPIAAEGWRGKRYRK